VLFCSPLSYINEPKSLVATEYYHVVVTTNRMARPEENRRKDAEKGCMTSQGRCGGQSMGMLSMAIVTAAAFLGNACKNRNI
jgi:hypothetical protein